MRQTLEGRGPQHPCVLLETGEHTDQQVVAPDVHRFEDREAIPNRGRRHEEPLDHEVCGVFVLNEEGGRRGQGRGRADLLGGADGGDAQGRAALGDVVAPGAHIRDDFIEVHVQRAEGRTDDGPMKLFALEGDVDELYERGLQFGRDRIAVDVGEGGFESMVDDHAQK